MLEKSTDSSENQRRNAMTKIEGRVVEADGDKALVHFADGVEKWFHRGEESAEEFAKAFPVGGTFTAYRWPVRLRNRADLFRSFRKIFKGLFEVEPDKSLVILGNSESKLVLVGQGLTLAGLTIFCARHCDTFRGGEKGFALGYPDGGTTWLGLTHEDFEYAVAEVAAAARTRARGLGAQMAARP